MFRRMAGGAPMRAPNADEPCGRPARPNPGNRDDHRSSAAGFGREILS